MRYAIDATDVNSPRVLLPAFDSGVVLLTLQMAVLWDVRVQGGEGKELYGKDYADIWAINRLHFTAASTYSCDHVSPCNFLYQLLFIFSLFSFAPSPPQKKLSKVFNTVI